MASKLGKTYQKKTDRQHILDAPDTYIGSVEETEYDTFVLETDNGETKIVKKNINIIPGLYKLFDEGIVNCRDHVARMAGLEKNKQNVPVSYIDISISEDGVITMINDGNGIDVAKHPEYDIWIPEMIFGHLRTSTNYDKDEKKIVGGKNGFGFKLVLIWSEWGSIETVDHNRKLKYTQSFRDNLNVIEQPVIVKGNGKPYTKVVFKPDYNRFGIPNGLSKNMIELLNRRIYDIAAVTDKKVIVRRNGTTNGIKTFQQYVDLYIGGKDKTPRLYEEGSERWEYCVCLSPYDEFTQVSFVNGIYTGKGGKHVEYIINQIVKKITAYILAKKKVTVKPAAIKEQLMIFLRCDIENPAFDSQTKDYMNTPVAKFGSTCTVSDKFIEKLAKMGVMSTACQLTEVKESKAATKTDGSKSKSIRGIPKLVDANYAGTTKSSKCCLIFCEGDSAKAGVVSGLSNEDRNYYGVYPLKGKLLNVRGEAVKKIAENKEITEIKQILGLQNGKKYSQESVNKDLRYGRVIFMTDQDLDGSHIKGLGINLFQSEWPELSKIPGFIGFMNTPILRATKGKEVKLFYNDGQYNSWKEHDNAAKGFAIKYYKGLGTSTSKEFKEYFKEKKFVTFQHDGKSSDNSIDKVFNKKRANDRKDWLGEYDGSLYLDTNKSSVKYEEFIDREMIHFSKYDNDRSIPNMMDGLKMSLRKILYSAFKRNLTKEIKVAQFSGYVSEHSGYHHGEASLNGAIVGMAQNFVGSNNINLLRPNGQFGTRLAGGKDSASERYIFTQLETITRKVFIPADDKILDYRDDDGDIVEPLYYAPIIPMILVNGALGIGTGFSTQILCYNPKDIITTLKQRLTRKDGETLDTSWGCDIMPYYRGFTGSVKKVTEGRYLIKGKYQREKNDILHITELPVGYWTDDFKQHLENLMDAKSGKNKKIVIKDYDDMSTDVTVCFKIKFVSGTLDELEKQIHEDGNYNGIEKLLKLYSFQSTSNMNLFDADDKLKKYETTGEIMCDFYNARIKLYSKRRKTLIAHMEELLKVLSNKAKYIQENLAGTIDLRRKKQDEITKMLQDKGYDKKDDDYKYLVKMPMDSVTEENVVKLMKEFEENKGHLEKLQKTTKHQMWIEDLDILVKELI
jgi:DNA topoisomerase-2